MTPGATPLAVDYPLNRRTLLGAGALAAVGSLAGCLGREFSRGVEVSAAVERTFDPAEVESVRISNTIGDVTVLATETDQVRARVLKRSTVGRRGLDDIAVAIGLDGGVLSVETRIADQASWFTRSSPSTDVTVTVPRGAAGPAITAIESALGDIDLVDTRGDTAVTTELGEVTATGVDGYLSLHSQLGTILASDVAGLDRVTTDLGEVKVDLLDLRGDVEIGTELGEVVVGVADDLDLDVMAESDGGLSSNLQLAELRSGGGQLSGRQNRGGHRVHVYSELGDVSLRSIRRRA